MSTAEQVIDRLNEKEPPTNPDSWRCRLGIHKMKKVAEGEDGLLRRMAVLKRCTRCGKPEERETFSLVDG